MSTITGRHPPSTERLREELPGLGPVRRAVFRACLAALERLLRVNDRAAVQRARAHALENERRATADERRALLLLPPR